MSISAIIQLRNVCNQSYLHYRLSGEELYEHIVANSSVRSVPKKGVKDFAPDGSQSDARKLEEFYDSYENILRHERVKSE